MTTTTDEAPAFARLLRNYLASGESAHSLAMDKWAKTHGLLTQAATTIEQLQQENERLQQQVERYRDRAQATRKLYEMTYNDVESLLRDWVPAACNLITDIAEQPENSDG